MKQTSVEIRSVRGNWSELRILTANTRNSEVLPAFCNPIIVMSISVALFIAKSSSAYRLSSVARKQHKLPFELHPAGFFEPA